MTHHDTAEGADFVVGMAVELRRTGPGVGDHAEAHVGHAVRPTDIATGEKASRAVCGTMSTVDVPRRTYHLRGGLDYMDCRKCIQHVSRSR